MTTRDRTMVLVLALAALVAAGWFLVLAPMRDEAGSLSSQIDVQHQTLDAAMSDVAAGAQARERYAHDYATVARLGAAVPEDDNVASLLVQVQHAAGATGIDFRSLKVGQGAGAATPAPPAPATDASSAATQATTATLPPGALVGPAGFPTMPFAFTFTGDFFKMSDFIGRLERFLVVRNRRLSVSGRFMTIDGIGLDAASQGFPRIRASVAATTYLLPATQGLTDGATADGPATATPASAAGATGAAPSLDPGRDRDPGDAMRAVRDLWSELVERRLWPVALLLVAALVAVPVLLAKPAADGTATGAAAAPAAAAARAADLRSAGEPVVSVATGAGADAPLRGHTKNPFKQQFMPKRASVAGGSPATGTSTTPAGGGGSPTTGDNGGAGGGGSDQGQTPQTYTYASIAVRFGRAGQPLRTIHDVPRLTPLPSAAQPIVIFMGMQADHETAVFMVSTDVHAQGEGTCVPSKKVCESIELRRDQIALLDWAEPDGSVTQYELDLADVTLHETTSKAKAQATVAEARASWMQRDGAGVSVHDGAAPQAAAGTVPRGPSLVPLP